MNNSQYKIATQKIGNFLDVTVKSTNLGYLQYQSKLGKLDEKAKAMCLNARTAVMFDYNGKTSIPIDRLSGVERTFADEIYDPVVNDITYETENGNLITLNTGSKLEAYVGIEGLHLSVLPFIQNGIRYIIVVFRQTPYQYYPIDKSKTKFNTDLLPGFTTILDDLIKTLYDDLDLDYPVDAILTHTETRSFTKRVDSEKKWFITKYFGTNTKKIRPYLVPKLARDITEWKNVANYFAHDVRNFIIVKYNDYTLSIQHTEIKNAGKLVIYIGDRFNTSDAMQERIVLEINNCIDNARIIDDKNNKALRHQRNYSAFSNLQGKRLFELLSYLSNFIIAVEQSADMSEYIDIAGISLYTNAGQSISNITDYKKEAEELFCRILNQFIVMLRIMIINESYILLAARLVRSVVDNYNYFFDTVSDPAFDVSKLKVTDRFQHILKSMNLPLSSHGAAAPRTTFNGRFSALIQAKNPYREERQENPHSLANVAFVRKQKGSVQSVVKNTSTNLKVHVSDFSEFSLLTTYIEKDVPVRKAFLVMTDQSVYGKFNVIFVHGRQEKTCLISKKIHLQCLEDMTAEQKDDTASKIGKNGVCLFEDRSSKGQKNNFIIYYSF